MPKTIQRRFALSEKGARDFCKGVFFTTLLDLALMLPAVFVFLFLDDYLRPVFDPDASVVHGAVFYLLLGLAFMLVMYAAAVLQYRSTYTTVYDESAARRISLAEKLRKLPLAFFGEKNLSDLTATIMDDCTDLEHTFSHAVPQLFASLAGIALIAAGMFIYDWRLSLALFWVVPLALAAILLSKKKMRRDVDTNYRNRRAVTECIQEGLDTVQEIKSYNREEAFLSGLDSAINRYEKELTRGELLTGVLVNGAQSFLKLGLATVVIVGAGLLASGKTELFVWLVFMVIGSRIYGPVNEVLNNLAALFYLDKRIDRMNEMEALPAQQGTTEFAPDGFDIEFDHVSFAYESGKQVLKDVSFTARQGEITALVGPSGSGKSTAARLAARFWDIQSGQIRLGGRDIGRTDPETLLKNYSVVFQDVVLFNASVKDNIRIGRRDASDEEVVRAARLAQCDTFVERMPQGYDTVIGENGETLSGGERQRISIARALLKDAPIVLLDEATASLDVENETRIQAAIAELVRDKTVLIIAHRMRTVANADKVIVLENGRVAETGTPEELKRRNGLFARMVERQTAE
ncbi:ABC transporter ATP-binding protein [Rikenella microfusus]|uniref:Multidrug export ATP-binding/permease protein SAV1866 n=2 Tax=Rikenella microfusus TaxID=28139 RepID=A0A379MSY2_9BACT|nr:ABC transporter ATP-binding protein [Rikenella microfusus]SUE34516.1 Putative multidrug export ATP-binding/permease protein SAV1866 [Rikenella microfusus]